MPRDPHDARWLSEGVEELIVETAAAPDALHCDVLIVGSGYGGAVAAARLAGAREADGAVARVLVLERGQEYLPGMFPATFGELPGHVRFSAQDGAPARGRAEGLFDLRFGGDLNVVLGNGLGGGSLINAAVMERPEAEVFRQGWPQGIDLETLRAHYERAERMLAPEQLPGSVPKLDSLLAAGAAMGAHEARRAFAAIAFADGATPAGVAMRACLQCGDCVTGCNHRAKKSLDVNYLALARANGARLYCGATVMCVLVRAAGGYAVEFGLTDRTKARTDRRPYVLNARRVILAAGSLGSTEILMRSRDAGLPIAAGAALGSRFSGNGDLIAVAHRQKKPAPCCAREGDAPADRHVGPTITGLVRHRVRDDNGNEHGLVFEEFAIPAPLRRLLGEVVATTAALHGVTKTDRSTHRIGERCDDPLAVSDADLDRTPVYGMMGDDGAAGTLQLMAGAVDADATDAQIRVGWDDAGKIPLFRRQVEALRAAHEGVVGKPRSRTLGGRVLPNPLWQPLPPYRELDGSVQGPPTTVHPLGGCPMAGDAGQGVVDASGRVFAAVAGDRSTLRGLAVLDGSIVPVSLGINPALTIAALAERAIAPLAEDWTLSLRAQDAPLADPRPVRRDVARPHAPAPTKIRLQERMTGRLVIDGRTFDTGAVVDFAPVDVAALRRLPRGIEQPEVRLSFSVPGQPTLKAICCGHAEVLVRESSTLVSRVQRCIDLVRRKLRVNQDEDPIGCSPWEFIALCSHLGEVRLIRYDWLVTTTDEGAPVQPGQHLQLTKRIEFVEGGNPWRQLTEGQLDRLDFGATRLGRLVLDPSFFVERLAPLLRVEAQQDQPNALGDLAEAGLWVLRIVLRIHLLNFLPTADQLSRVSERLPMPLPDAPMEAPVVLEPPALDGSPPRPPHPVVTLSRYPAPARGGTQRPVVLLHGYGASGSTFAHPSIGGNLVQALHAAGREAWVVDLRTSIGHDAPDHPRTYWSFDEVARGDIPFAIGEVLARTDTRADGKVDVVAHCIGAAMFSVAALDSPSLHERIGCVVLSQVGPLLRMSAFNRFRGYVASYVQQFIGTAEFDVKSKPDADIRLTWLVNGLLATFPYPDDDGEAERLRTRPGFDTVRHRADAIFGQTMQLANIGDDTLEALDAIYGWVMVRGLAQTIHYAREHLLTNSAGLNDVVAFDRIATRFNFPLLMLHGRRNALFDWRGSYDTVRLLARIFDGESLPDTPADGHAFGAGARRLRVLDGYGHQDTLIGVRSHRDVFPHVVAFLDEFAAHQPAKVDVPPPLRAELPWMGPTLGRVTRDARALTCRIALRPPPARATLIGVVLVPALRKPAEERWTFRFDEAVIAHATRDDLADDVLVVKLALERVPDYQGFAVVTVHDDLPAFPRDKAFGKDPDSTPFIEPRRGPQPGERLKVQELLDSLGATRADLVDLAVVRLDPAWIAAAEAPGAAPHDALVLALASCQYPPGLVDRIPAQRSLARLAQHVTAAPVPQRPQLLLMMGDQVYVDETAGLFEVASTDDVDRAYQLNFTLPDWRRATRALPTLPLPDDHEVKDNWEPEQDPAPAADALARYRAYQHKLVDDRRGPPFDFVLAPAGFPLFALDVRTRRDRRTLRAAAGALTLEQASIDGAGVLADLLAWLRKAPPDVPKFIVSSTTVFPFPRTALAGSGAERIGLDDWSGYPRSTFALMDFIRRENVRHVVLLSGDRHLSSVSSLWLDDVPGGAPLEVVSIVSSALHAPWPFANAPAEELVLEGPVVFRHVGDELHGTMVPGALGLGAGFATLRVARDAGTWRIDVRLDLEDGIRLRRRLLGDAGDRTWRTD